MNYCKGNYPQLSFIRGAQATNDVLQNRLITQQSVPITSSSNRSTSTTTFQLPSNVNLAIEVTTTGPEELRNRRYKLKCVRVQRQIKEIIFLNAALQAEVVRNKEKLTKLKSQRKFLTNKLLSYQKDMFNDANSRILQQALSKKNNNERQSSLDGVGGGISGVGVGGDEGGAEKESKKVQRPASTPLPTCS